MKNKVSIITIIFEPNLLDLEKNLLSVLNQNYQNIEHILQDGSHSLNAKKLIQKFKLKYQNNNIHYFHEKDLGIYDALNKGIEKSSGDIIGMLHCDDTFFNNSVLSLVMNNFNHDIHIVYGDLIYVNSKDKIIRKWIASLYDFTKLKFGWMPPHPTMFIKKNVFDDYGYYNINYKIAGDYEFIVRLFKRNDLKIKYISNTITKMKLGGASNNSIKNLVLKSKEDLTVIRNNKIGGFYTLIFKNIRKLNQFL